MNRKDLSPYYIIDADVLRRIHETLNLARAMAKDSYPHLVDGIQFAIDRMEETTEVFFGREHKPQATKAYKTK